MVASHIVGLQKLASDRQVCIFVRAVNPESTSLIREGFGTKDMAIKGKSSKIPPLSALIPRDQAYGKKAFDPNLPEGERRQKVAELSAYNDKAIAEHRATSVDLSLGAARIKGMTRAGLEIRGSWIDAQPGDPLPSRSGLMVAKVDEQDFKFWGEKQDDGSVSIFHATEGGGVPSKGDRVQVMGNREGKIVTADYDLALIAPRIEDYGAQHTRPLKITSSDEMARRTGIGMKALAHDDRQWSADQASKAATAQSRGEAPDGGTAPMPMPAGTTRGQVFGTGLDIAEATTQERYAAIEGMDPSTGPPPLKDFGNISRFTKDLIPELNGACGVPVGGEVFHHSDDAGNPFSVEADNYPMTVILPDNERLSGSEKIQIVKDGAELKTLFRTLKDGGFMPIGTDRWDDRRAAPQDRLTGVRSDDFGKAQRVVARHLAGEVISDHIDPDRPQRRAESRVEKAHASVSQADAEAGAARRSASRDFHGRRITADQMTERVRAAETMAEAARDELSIALMSKPV